MLGQEPKPESLSLTWEKTGAPEGWGPACVGAHTPAFLRVRGAVALCPYVCAGRMLRSGACIDVSVSVSGHVDVPVISATLFCSVSASASSSNSAQFSIFLSLPVSVCSASSAPADEERPEAWAGGLGWGPKDVTHTPRAAQHETCGSTPGLPVHVPQMQPYRTDNLCEVAPQAQSCARSVDTCWTKEGVDA